MLVVLPSHLNKLKAKWQGLHPVPQRLSQVTYRIRMDNKSKTKKFHIDM